MGQFGWGMARACPIILVVSALLAIALVSTLRPAPPPARAASTNARDTRRTLQPIAHDHSEFKFAIARSPQAIVAQKQTARPPVSLYAPLPVAQLRTAAKVYIPDIELPDAFEAEGKNPCWKDLAGTVHCLPAFLLLGVYQSGAHDVYHRLAKHPLVARNPAVSPSFYSEVHPWKHYMTQLSSASKTAHGTEMIIGECSAVTFHFTWVHGEQFNQACKLTPPPRHQQCRTCSPSARPT